ncbi:uncharacterized protein LOC5568409 isoform X2 [Aedes aegypti]|uniref:Phospholipase A2 n=1 Tax=Aedes aegypti TaxID=7159 RepID=A0A6I8TD83_AEDAE|nr:uncharacterized protein LOC5568409 isoform X2 [Aedes aegypti]
MASNPMMVEKIVLIVVIVLGSLLSVVHNDPVKRFQKVTKIDEEESTQHQELESREASTPVVDITTDGEFGNTTENEADSVGISTVMVKLKHFGTKNFTFLEPDLIPISDFMDLDENVDLELLFSEQMNADHSQSGSPVENVVVQIEDYDDEGNSQSYFLHSSPYSESFFRDVLQRLGVYKYILDYQADGQSEKPNQLGPKVPHRFHPHFINTPKGIRNLPNHFVDQVSPSLTSTTPVGIGASSSTKRPPKPHKTHGGGLFNQFKQRIKAIYPGTVWCGDGNQAKSENDIGFFYMTDACCRAHDLCPAAIAAGEQFNRLKNNGYFTRSHCDCDKQFYNCLKNANTLVSNQIGYTYFNLLKPQCFRHEHPKVACSKKIKGKCITYVVDENQDKVWQWFDNLIY